LEESYGASPTIVRDKQSTQCSCR